MDTMDYEEDEDDVAAGEALTGPLSDAFSGLQGDEQEYLGQEEQRTFSRPDEDRRPKLFAGLKVFVNREAPLEWMQLCLLSHGAQLGWEGPSSPFPVTEESITHQIIDRPAQGIQSKGREYVQPQWVFDSINAQTLLPVGKYLPGVPLPPHLSPFVDDAKEGYTPKYREEIQQLQASSSASVVSGMSDPAAAKGKGKKVEKEEIDMDEDEEEDEEAYERELKAEKKGKSYSASKAAKENEDEEEDEEEGEEEGEDDEEEEDEEEEVPVPPKGQKGVVHKPKAVAGLSSENAEEGDLAKIMMSKKTKRLYGRMQHGIQKKQEAVDRLEEKRIEIENKEKTPAEPLNKKQKKGAAASAPAVVKEKVVKEKVVKEKIVLKEKIVVKEKAATPKKAVASKKEVVAKKASPAPVKEKETASKSSEKGTKRKR